MMYDSAIDQALAEAKNTKIEVVKLGEVTSVSGGRPKIKHFGETSSSSKNYACIDGYFPEVGDTVAMLQQANTYIILGKVINAAPVEKYLTEDAANRLYLAIGYKGKLEDGSQNTLTLDAATLKPNTNNNIELGTSSLMFKNLYTKKLMIDGSEVFPSKISYKANSSTTYSLSIGYTSYQAVIEPSADNTINLGSNSKKFKESFLGDFRGSWKSNVTSGTIYDVSWDSGTKILPSANKAVDLGSSSKQFKNIYGQNLYANGTAVTSDFRKKKDIKSLGHRFVEFIKALRPVSFKYKDGTSGRRHTGFIAQEVEEAVKEAGMTDLDMAVVVKDAEGEYYLRYDELIAVQTKAIQELMAKVDSLEARIRMLENR